MAGDERADRGPGRRKGGTARDLLELGRFHFLFGGLVLFGVGVLLALNSGAPFPGSGRFLLGYAILFCAHLSVSYSNDYFDSEGDRFNSPTAFTGGSGVLQRRPDLRPPALKIAWNLILASLLLTLLYCVLFGFSLVLVAFVAAGNALGWFYTAPPLKLAYRGLGEMSMMVTAGLLVPGYGYLLVAGEVSWPFWLWVAPMLMYGLMFISSVQVPDIEGDRRSGKRTLVARRGASFGLGLAAAMAVGATAWFAALAWATWPGSQDLWGGDVAFPVVAAMSVFPAAVGLKGPGAASDRKKAALAGNANVGALMLFVALVDLYLLAVLLF